MLTSSVNPKSGSSSKSEGSRGAYSSIAKGLLPKREVEESIKKLAEKNAKNLNELEKTKKTLKRRDEKIKILEDALKAANGCINQMSDDYNLLSAEFKTAQERIHKLGCQVNQQKEPLREVEPVQEAKPSKKRPDSARR